MINAEYKHFAVWRTKSRPTIEFSRERFLRVGCNDMFGREPMLRAKDEGANREGRLRSWAFRLQRRWAEALERNIYVKMLATRRALKVASAVWPNFELYRIKFRINFYAEL